MFGRLGSLVLAAIFAVSGIVIIAEGGDSGPIWVGIGFLLLATPFAYGGLRRR